VNLNEILFWAENDEMSRRNPLGTKTFAGQLAELILPGLTTITWRVRCVTLVCLWLKFIKEELQQILQIRFGFAVGWIKRNESTISLIRLKVRLSSGETCSLSDPVITSSRFENQTEKNLKKFVYW